MRPLLLILAALLAAVPAHADTLIFPNTILIIPNGSTVTNTFILPIGQDGPFDAYVVDFTFTGGHGSTGGNENEGNQESLFFDSPVSAIHIIANNMVAEIVGNDGTILFRCHAPFFPPSPFQPCGTYDLNVNGITSLTFIGEGGGYNGIDSLSFAVATPEPGTLLLLGMGLLGVAIARKWLPLRVDQ